MKIVCLFQCVLPKEERFHQWDRIAPVIDNISRPVNLINNNELVELIKSVIYVFPDNSIAG